MKKQSKLLLVCACGMLLTACGNSSSSLSPDPSVGPQPAPSSSSAESSSLPESDSEKAMKNFYAKIKDGNYTITSERSVVSVYSRDVAMIEYDPSIAGAKNEGVISANNETFVVNLEAPGNIFDYIRFVDQGPTIDVAGEILPNHWFASGDVWDFWQHDDTKPAFEFYSLNADVKKAISEYYVLGELDALTIKDMHLVFDSVDVNTAQIKAKYIKDSGTSKMTPVDITIDITFGGAKFDQRLVDWVNDPDRQYPADVGKIGNWGTLIDTLLASELMVSDFKTYCPVMPFASYAVICNSDTFLSDGYAYIHDYHAKEENVGEYIELLENNAFYKVTMDGQDWYRKHMRTKSDNAIFEVFSDIHVFYDDNGVSLIVNAYYNRQTLHGFDPVNNLIKGKGFPELDPNVPATDYEFFNSPFEGQENKMYFYNYDTTLIGTFTYDDANAFNAYVASYCQALEAAGFVRGPDKDIIVYSKGDTANERKIIMEQVNDNTSKFFFTNEVYVNPDQAIGRVNDAGFPTMTADHILNVQDHTVNRYLTGGEKWDVYYAMDFAFDTAEETSATGTAYIQALEDNPNFIKNEEESGSRQGAYDSLDKKLKVIVDWKNGDKGLYFWFGIKA